MAAADLPPGLPDRLADALDRIWAILPEARLVGGAVRDLLAERAVVDLDLATPRPPEAVIDAVQAAGLTAIPTGLAHGTVSAMVGADRVEITTLRRDVTTDGRHATVAWTDDWREDAARRDFTINAMSLDREGRLHDAFGGLDDLRAGRVRFVGRASARIAEDRLRSLRYFRFLARFGGGSPPDAEATAAIGAAVGELGSLSAERVWSELRRLFETPAIGPVVGLMGRLGVFGALFGPALRAEGAGLLLRLEAAAGDEVPPVLVRLAALVRPGQAGQVAGILRLSRAEAGGLAALLASESLSPSSGDDALRAARDVDPAEILAGRAWLAQAAARGAPDAAWSGLRARLAGLAQPGFAVQGSDVVAAGVAPGPGVGEVLSRLRAWWRGQGCRPDRAACLTELDRMLRD